MVLYANEKDISRCMVIVRTLLKHHKVEVGEDNLRRITIEIMNISYSTGGDYSDDIIKSYAESYVEEKHYEKFLNRKD
jgi:hypothetical protein